MVSISLYSPGSNPIRNGVSSVNRSQSSTSSALQLSLLGSRISSASLSLSVGNTGKIPSGQVRLSVTEPVNAPRRRFDVVIVGAGIIGLTIARQFLVGSDLSVAVVDKAVPFSGATGAGQGYIWLGHKTPGSVTWELNKRSHQLWGLLAESIRNEGGDPLEELGWKKTGSLLVARTAEELVMLEKRVKQLTESGVRAELLSSSDLLLEEPALSVGGEGGAAFVPNDCQLDAHRTVSYIEKANRRFAAEGRYAEYYHEPVSTLVRSSSSGEVEAIQTSNNTLHAEKAIIIAAGCWSGALMHDLLRGSNVALDIPVKPRKGQLLVLENFVSLKLNHGLMEVGYVDHQNAVLTSGNDDEGQSLSISMTATMDTTGNLLLGSSRQFAGFSTEADEAVIFHIWKRAGEFFPQLKAFSLSDFISNGKVRIGLRPYMPDGKPVIGCIPGLSNVFIAAGHEGQGLCMALGTAEMVVDMVLGNSTHVDHSTFAIEGRYYQLSECSGM